MSYCDCGGKKENRRRIWHLAGSSEERWGGGGWGVFENYNGNNISAAIEPHKMCSEGIKRMRLHLIFFEVALAIKCGSW